MKNFFLVLFVFLAVSQVDAQVRYTHNLSLGSSVVLVNPSSDDNHPFITDSDETYLGLKLDYAGLFELNKKVSIGFGTGFRHFVNFDGDYYWDNGNAYWDYDNSEFFDDLISYYMIPVYAQAKFRFLNKKVSPYLNTSLGYSFGINNASNDNYDTKLNSGLMANGSAGVSIRFRNSSLLTAGPYLEFQKSDKIIDHHSSQIKFKNSTDLYQIGLQIGFAF